MSYDLPQPDEGPTHPQSDMDLSEKVARRCVRCGFCNATCPTYVELGDELDGPRGRISLIRNMLASPAAPAPEVVKHIDRCLSCLGCETTCPSGVSYRRLIDHARGHVEKTYRRPLVDRAWRAVIAAVVPHRGRFALALRLGRLMRPLQPLVARVPGLQPAARMLQMASRRSRTSAFTAQPRDGVKVAVFESCVEPGLAPEVEVAARRLLNRAGCEIARLQGDSCCGTLAHHMGREDQALRQARDTVDRLSAAMDAGVAYFVVTASGCGAVMRDYGHLLRHDPLYAQRAAQVSRRMRDITEVLAEVGLPPSVAGSGVRVAYHASCSQQHAQRLRDLPVQLLNAAGFTVSQPQEAHLCCGAAGAYTLLQPRMSDRLGRRKAGHLDAGAPEVIASGNVGCAVQIAAHSRTPVVHTLQLLDWATGGPEPFDHTRKR